MQEEWANDTRNHCAPVAKVFKDHQNPMLSYIVMPLLRPVDDPPFERVKEIIDFTDQILEVTVEYLSTPAPNRASSGFGVSPRERGGT